MNLVSDWSRVLRHAWSVRLFALAVFFEIAGIVLPYFQDFIPDFTFRLLTLLAALGGLAARFIKQRNVSDGQQD
jgi:hypothetical protein